MESKEVKLICPKCGSIRVHNNGHRFRKDGSIVQRLKCHVCECSFAENVIRYSKTNNTCRISVKTGAKNMATLAEKETVKVDIENKLREYHLNLKIDGYAEATIKLSWGILEVLRKRGADLENPKSTKEVISKQVWSGNRKRNVIIAYGKFLKYLGLQWETPLCTIVRKIPFIPTEQEIDDLIAGVPLTVAAYLQLLKETGMRCGEAIKVRWKDVDLKRRLITCNNPEKNSNSRMFSDLSAKLLSMLNQLPKINDYLFGDRSVDSLKAVFTRCRAVQAYKLANPRLKEIHFHTLRHYYATMLYHYTKDVLLVQEKLGHKSIENTQLYIQLDKQLFQNVADDKFTIKAVHSIEEATQLGEVGFEPFMVIQGVQLMRKRK